MWRTIFDWIIKNTAWIDELGGDYTSDTIVIDHTMPEIPPITPPIAPVSPVHASRIADWANAIKIEEGASISSNNPGNLKYSTLTASWGATKGRAATDGGNLCQFPTYEKGFTALCNFLTLACEGQLIISHPQPCTLQAFSVRYAGNPPQGYIDQIAAKLGVSTSVDIATFL